MSVDLHMTMSTWFDGGSGTTHDVDPVVIAIDQPAQGRHDLMTEAIEFVDLITEVLPPETLDLVLERLVGRVFGRSGAIAVVTTVARGMGGRP